MRTLVQPTYGSTELRNLELPTPRPGEVLVEVHAAGLNAADRLMLRGTPYVIRLGAGGLRKPRPEFIPGRALAGRITALGPGVTDFAVGDDVLAEAPGALAGTVRVRTTLIARKPPTLDFATAAALPLAGTTALQMVRQIETGHRILITGAAGGIGTFAVQLAKVLKNAHVTAECAGRNVPVLTELGADEVIDYETATALPRDFDAVLDLAGNHTLGELRKCLKPGGTLLLSVGTGGRLLGPARRILAGAATAPLTGRRLRTLVARPDPADLHTLATMAGAGQIRPVIDTVFAFDDAPAAMHRLNHGPVTGKIVVTVNDSR